MPLFLSHIQPGDWLKSSCENPCLSAKYYYQVLENAQAGKYVICDRGAIHALLSNSENEVYDFILLIRGPQTEEELETFLMEP